MTRPKTKYNIGGRGMRMRRILNLELVLTAAHLMPSWVLRPERVEWEVPGPLVETTREVAVARLGDRFAMVAPVPVVAVALVHRPVHRVDRRRVCARCAHSESVES